MRRSRLRGWGVTLVLAGTGLAGCVTRVASTDDEARSQVEATERAFAKTMAGRDFAGFQRFLAQEAVFISGAEALRGRDSVARQWARYFQGAAAPFSWTPDRVEVLDSGTLALSTGPVLDPQGQLIGRFTSIWRQEAPGVWRIVFDRGEPAP